MILILLAEVQYSSLNEGDVFDAVMLNSNWVSKRFMVSKLETVTLAGVDSLNLLREIKKGFSLKGFENIEFLIELDFLAGLF